MTTTNSSLGSCKMRRFLLTNPIISQQTKRQRIDILKAQSSTERSEIPFTAGGVYGAGGVGYGASGTGIINSELLFLFQALVFCLRHAEHSHPPILPFLDTEKKHTHTYERVPQMLKLQRVCPKQLRLSREK